MRAMALGLNPSSYLHLSETYFSYQKIGNLHLSHMVAMRLNEINGNT